MRKDDTIVRETFRPGDRVRAYITAVKKDLNGPQIYLSRTCNEFMGALFSQGFLKYMMELLKLFL